MHSGDQDAKVARVASSFEAANDDALPVVVGASAAPVAAAVAPLADPAAAPAPDAGWDP